MIHKLKIRLVALYTVTASAILVLVLFGACYINIVQIKNNSLDDYKELRETLVNKLQSENIVAQSWLSQLEAANHLIIHIEDNGTPFLFKGSWKSSTPRAIMINRAKKAALAEGIDTSARSFYSDNYQSSLFHLRGNHREAAYASMNLISVKGGVKSLTLVQFHPDVKKQIILLLFLYLFIYLAGCLALFLVSLFYVGKALEPVVKSQKRQNEFIAAASHDLRSPLAVIQANASSLLIEENNNKQFVPKIMDECSRMSKLIGDMLILASSDAKTWTIQKSPIDTETYLIDLYDTFLTYCKKKEHNLYLDFPREALPQILVDKDRLTQVISILIDNALSYSPAQTTITLRPYLKKSVFYLEIEDHGIGITKEQKEHIFDRFYRADLSRSDKSHFGLGLSVAKELIELQEGQIKLKDSFEGGSTFIIELPA
ncbi:sensor histidine kinase [Anaerocolumna sp. MB42-C2]|uniref:sensor histidine kinase n=1 Tax=Anaerocolumna sp. MB42-C2 TaxID=3070997 RepID=UPI0027DFED2E|nr:HAMP domain-containing sensor histidine kinase [Anaerocolumna sp. MB42-C2]WMJ87695.1 HAMP domain-containing sensor histidine kinase [Anaerocolumna sp. MB42-C2]